MTDVTGQMENMMKHALKEHRIRPEKMLVLEHGDSRQEAYITMRSENGRCVTSKDLAETLSSETHRRWRPAADSRAVIGRESRTVKFEEDTEFLMLHGIARAVKNEENLSGRHLRLYKPSYGEGFAVSVRRYGIGTGCFC